MAGSPDNVENPPEEGESKQIFQKSIANIKTKLYFVGAYLQKKAPGRTEGRA